jgi:hypothetical protein
VAPIVLFVGAVVYVFLISHLECGIKDKGLLLSNIKLLAGLTKAEADRSYRLATTIAKF